ncbi:MAG: succinate dehydrogenase assembly factor 2 [Thermodesulforhabdaceae bacterium]
MSLNEGDNLALRKKKIKYHVSRRANLELEALLRNFWTQQGESLSEDQIKDFENILELNDLDLLEMILGIKPVLKKEWENIILMIRRSWNQKKEIAE